MQLPIINSEQEALALAHKADDYFYCVAYKLQLWISQLNLQANAAYAEHPDPADRNMQSGQAWSSFQPAFANFHEKAFYHLLGFLVRFSRSDNPISITLLSALAPLYLEHEMTGDYLNFEHTRLSPPPPLTLVPLMRRSVQRMCDWLEAVIHSNMHRMSFREPACFHPDPETRRLASRHMSQQYIAQMAEPTLVAPYIAPSPSKNRLPISPPTTVAPATASDDPYNRLNQSIITLWPLLKLHNWTYADLCTVLRDCAIPTSPCDNHRQLAHYCLHTLGLRKSGYGHTADSHPPGFAVARRLLCRPHPRPLPGSTPWS